MSFARSVRCSPLAAWLLVAWLPVGFSAGLLTAQAPHADEAISKATGKYFQLVCHGGDEALAQRALAAIEPVWPLVCAAFGVADATPAQPLAVHLYRTPGGYVEVDRRLTGGKFAPNQAMSHWDSKTAHVALQPPVHDEFLREFGLPMQTQALLAWEACHVARFELCANFRSQPGWFHDGLAATVARAVLQQLHADLGEQPFFTQRWLRLRQLVDQQQLPKVGDLLADATGALEMRDRYALRIAFFEYAQGGKSAKLLSVSEQIRTLDGGDGYERRVSSLATTAFGGLDREFVAHIEGVDPVWDEAIRSLWCCGDEWRQIAFPDKNAVAWRRQPVAGGGFDATGEVRILAGDARQLNFLFARTDEGFHSLALTAGFGFTLFEHRFNGNEWRRIGSGREPALQVGKYCRFGVTARGTDLMVQLADHSWSFELPRPLPESIVWGIGAQAGRDGASTGTAGIWRAVTVVPR